MKDAHQLAGKFEVVVCGGGTAGTIAALATARQGAQVLVIEAEGFLGGNATTGLPFLGFFGPEGKQIVGGIPDEIVSWLLERGASPGHIRDPRWYSFTPFNPAVLKLLLLELLVNSRVAILFHSSVIGVRTQDDASIGKVVVQTVSGLQEIEGQVIIDCTGDAKVARLAGAPVEKARKLQSASLVFRLDGFNRTRFIDFLHRNPTEIRGLNEGWTPEWYAKRPFFAFCGLFSRLQEANAKGLNLPREFICFNTSYRPEEVTIVATRVLGCDGTEAGSLSSGEITGQLQVLKVVDFLQKSVPGFENARLQALGHRLGIRETFRLVGDYVLTEQDICSGRNFPDTIALGSWPIDIHSGVDSGQVFRRLDKSYGIPYRCLFTSRIPNLLVAGRSISTTHMAQSSTRTMAQCMAIGQAAGVAAALALKNGANVVSVSSRELRERLKEQGAILNLGGKEGKND